MKESANSENGRAIRLHVVGCPRSGTTLVAELLATCFAGVGHDEHELSIFRPVPPGHEIYVSKKPADVKRIGPLLRADPDLYVVAVHRDPRAVITSVLEAASSRYWMHFDNWARCIRAARALDGHPRFLDVRYERLATEPDAVQAEIAARFAFLRRAHAFSEFDRHARPSHAASLALGGVRAVDAQSVERWREHLPRVKAELQRHPEMTRMLIELGYERDDAWTRVLDAVEAYDEPRQTRLRLFFENLDASLRYRLKQRRYLRDLERRREAPSGRVQIA